MSIENLRTAAQDAANQIMEQLGHCETVYWAASAELAGKTYKTRREQRADMARLAEMALAVEALAAAHNALKVVRR